MAALFPDRVIAIKGTLEGMSQAESAISAKLAECIEQDQAQSFVSFFVNLLSDFDFLFIIFVSAGNITLSYLFKLICWQHGGIMMPHGPLGPNCFYPNGRIYEVSKNALQFILLSNFE